MNKVVEYEVLREHEGDRFYRRGERRELLENEAKHLVGLGVLGLPGSSSKAAPAAAGARTRSDIEAEFNSFVDKANQARGAIEAELTKARQAADGKINEIAAEVTAARQSADAALGSIQSELDTARKDADAKIRAIAAEIEKAKSEASGKGKPEEQPSNKVEQAPEKNK